MKGIKKSDLTVKVKLLNSVGDLVCKANIIPMNPMPEMLIWGQRFFTKKDEETYTEGIIMPVMSVDLADTTTTDPGSGPDEDPPEG